MKKMFIAFLCIIGMSSFAQNKLSFEYDSAGNQIVRKYCPSCPAKTSEPPKDMDTLTEEDLLKFFPEDVISYYPNPVKDQLFIKWQLKNNNRVSKIDLYSIDGQLLKSFQKLEDRDSFIISFSELPQYIYSINLIYNNGEQKAIKVIKN